MKDYKLYERTINSVRGSLKKWQIIQNNSQADKIGFGFNSDSRFASFTIELMFSSWVGYYGNSSCSTWFEVGDDELFKRAFVIVLNRRALELFGEVADFLENESFNAKKKEIEELRSRLELLEK